MFLKYYFYAVLFGSCAYFLLKQEIFKNVQVYVLKFFLLNPDVMSSLNTPTEKLFTSVELASFIGEKDGPIYLSILGNVFDVTRGRKHYGKTGSYNIFAGKDGSKAFVTGDFTEAGATDDISELSLEELGDLYDWLSVYKKDYLYIGKLIGRFYGSDGSPTLFLNNVEEKLGSFKNKKKDTEKYKMHYPPCNVEWTPESGSKFWCSKKSGGIKRDWIGVPRKFYQPGSTAHRCACINPVEEPHLGKILQYDGCPPLSSECTLKT